MNEPRPDFSRVVVDVRSEHLADLMTTLGGFALQHDSTTVRQATGPGATTEGSVFSEEDPGYNPELVTWTEDPETGARFATVTELNLNKFAVSRGYSSSFPARVFGTLWRSTRHDPIHGPGHSTREYFYSDTVRVEGLLARKLPELVDALACGRLRVNLVGPHAIKLLEEYTQALYKLESA